MFDAGRMIARDSGAVRSTRERLDEMMRTSPGLVMEHMAGLSEEERESLSWLVCGERKGKHEQRLEALAKAESLFI